MSKSHRTPEYILSRFRQMQFQRKRPDAPWLARGAIDAIEQLLKSSDKVIEYGSGRSTAWFAARCARLTSVEHNEKWYKKVQADVSGIDEVDLIFRHLDGSERAVAGYLEPIRVADEHSIGCVLVDGKHRARVALAATSKVARGGLLVLDNAERYLSNSLSLPESIGPDPRNERSVWKEFGRKVCEWRRVWFSDGVTSTLIIFRP